jgi:hypothetical protein
MQEKGEQIFWGRYLVKKLIALACLLLATSSYANPYEEYDLPPGVKIQYDSWCEGDRIFTEDEEGSAFPKWDCSEFGRSYRCVEESEQNGQWTVVTATCKSFR